MDKELRDRIIKGLRGCSAAQKAALSQCGVHKSQVSRFRSGRFLRLSKNLSKVCAVLQIEFNNATTDDDLINAVHSAWDGSLPGKRRLMAILKTLQDWR